MIRHAWLLAAVSSAALLGVPLQRATAAQGKQRPLQIDSSYGCTACHADKRRAFLLGVHADRDIRCDKCHGGDPSSFTRPRAHRAPFVGKPTKLQTIQICSQCHADPNAMRQYGLPSGQLAELRSSRHGQLLLVRRDTNAPTCTDCHDAHTILPPSDARSNVHPLNIPATCARCHSDSLLMRRYDIPWNQYDEYRASAHGVGLFEQENLAAPTCVSCHGSHSALPPGVTEVANVCGQCHVLARQALFDGAHGNAARSGKLRGCLGCHANHSTEPIPSDSLAETCLKCHEGGSQAAVLGGQIEEWLLQAETQLADAGAALDAMTRAGRNIRDLRFRYRTARTNYLEMREAQHALDLAGVEDHGRRVVSIVRDIREAASVAHEQQWEHKLLVVPVWFLALAVVVLAAFKLAEVRRRH